MHQHQHQHRQGGFCGHMPTLNLKKFDMASVEDTSMCLLIGKRACGKSVAMRDLLYHHRDIPIGTIVSPLETFHRFYADFAPDSFIHDKFTRSLVDDVVQRQELIAQRVEKDPKIDPRAFFVMDVCIDDCMHGGREGDEALIKDTVVTTCFTDRRRLKLLTCVLLQYPLGLPTALRTAVDYVFIFREPVVTIRKRLYDNYAADIIPTFQMFCGILDAMIERFEFIVIHKRSKSDKIEDRVLWGRCPASPPLPWGWRDSADGADSTTLTRSGSA
jgi:hypothetical protein